MSVEVLCSSCSHSFQVGSHLHGSSIPCPECNVPVTVPTSSTAWWQQSPAKPTAVSAQPLAAPRPVSIQTKVNNPVASPPVPPAPPAPPVPAAPASHSAFLVLGSLAAALVTVGVAGIAGVLYLSRETPVEPGPRIVHMPKPVGLGLTHTPQTPTPPENPTPPPPSLIENPTPSRPKTETPVVQAPIATVKQTEKPKTPTKPDVSKPPIEETTPPVVPERIVHKRRVETTEDDLIKQIASVPELNLDRSGQRFESLSMVGMAVTAARNGGRASTTVAALERRADLVGLPLRKGLACELTPGSADHLQEGSLALRGMLFDAAQAGVFRIARGVTTSGSADPEKLHKLLMSNSSKHSKWLKPEGIPVLMQMLMAENEGIREVLIDQLAQIEGREATEALAQRALFDLHPRVRFRAIEALSKRPPEHYREILLKGFEYPWPVVSDHAAEALVSLKRTETVPTLLTFLDKPDPQAPYQKPGSSHKVIKEVVKINHLQNCLMCHAPSLRDDDKVRGFVPPFDRPLPPSFTREYYAPKQKGTFVRADITYIKQDFSLPLPVRNPGVWPGIQRFDFLTRERKARDSELVGGVTKDPKKPSQQQQALLFSLRELTGKDAGPTTDDWKKLFLNRKLEGKTLHRGLTAARALAVSDDGKAYVRDMGRVLLKQGDGRPTTWYRDESDITALALDRDGKILATLGKTGQLVRFEKNQELTPLASKFNGSRFQHLRHLVADRHGGVYFADDADDGSRVYYLSAGGNVSRLPVKVSKVRGLGLSPDNKTLYLGSGSSGTILAYSLDSAGSLGKSKTFYTLKGTEGLSGTPIDLTVDARGYVYVLNGSTRDVEVISSTGVRVGKANLSDTPVTCVVSGTRQQTLYVLTRTTIQTFDLSNVDPVLTARAK